MQRAVPTRRAKNWRSPARFAGLAILRVAWILTLLLCAVSCGDTDEAAPVEPEIDEISYEVFPTTRVLSTEDLDTIRSLTEDGTIEFAPAPRSLDGLEAGMVLVGGQSMKTPMGLLRGVGEVTRDGDRLTVRSMVVPIQFAFKRLSVRSAHRVVDLTRATEREGDGVRPRLGLLDTNATGKKSLRWVLFDGDGDEDTLDDQVRLEGELGGGFYFDARFEVNWGAVENLPQAVAECIKSIPGILIGSLPDCTPLALLPEAKATFEVGPDLFAHADLIGSASLEFREEIPILQLSLATIPIGPIVLVPAVDVIAELSGSAGARFRTGFDANLSARMALVASTKNGVSVTPPELTRSDVEARDTELAIMAKGRVSLGARISMSVYGIIGPYAQVNGFAELAADTSKDPCWEISAGLSANAGLLLTTPRLPVLGYVTLFDLKTPTWDIFKTGALASGTCSFGKEATLPGAGPGEQAYGQPEFPTWSTVNALPGEAFFTQTNYLGPDLAFTQTELTTDGRFLTSASGSGRLRKIDPSGAELWSRGFSSEEGPASLGRICTLRDSSIAVATHHGSGPAVVRIGQAGGLFAGTTYQLGEGCTPGPIAAIQALPATSTDPNQDAAYAFSGPCTEPHRAYLVAASSSGIVRFARVLSVPSTSSLVPRALAAVDDSLWWIGNYWVEGISHVAAARLDRELSPQAQSAYVGTCENNRRVDASFARPAALRSELLVVGSSGGSHEGLLLRLRPDATVAVASFPSYGPGASDVAVLQSIAELPTTGYVVSGSHFDVLAPAGSRELQMAPFIAWLDAAGSVFTAKRFTLDAGDIPTSSPRISLTDDGGMMFSAVRAGAGDQHELWNMKVFAKDGSVNDPRVSVSPLSFKAVSCGIGQVSLPLAVDDLSVTSSPLALTSD